MNQLATLSPEQQNLPATLDKIESAIALASRPEEINNVLALMDAAVAYAKRFYKDQADVIQRAKSLRLQAERRLGEILRDMPKSVGAMGSGSNQHEVRLHTETAPLTLAEIGIDKRTSSRAQKLAALPEKTFAAVASGDMPVAKAIATPKPAPKHKPVAEVRMEALKAAQQRNTSMLESYARLLLNAIKEHSEFTPQERDLLSQVASAISSI